LEAREARDLFRKRSGDRDNELENLVLDIIDSVRAEGDSALCSLSGRLDGCHLSEEQIKVSDEEIEQAVKAVDPEFIRSLRVARDNIRAYHEKQAARSWFDYGRDGVLLGQLIRPLERVGIYVPGGKASYPSSVLMNAIPAKVAGVPEIAMTSPPGKDGKVNIHTLAAAAEAGVNEIYRIGGAQAIAALAYGTRTVRRVDKIAGPGNRYVTMAKRMVFGAVDIDMLAGPSEILVVADDSANPSYVAADMLSQAEHDEMAAVVLVTPDRDLARSVASELERQIGLLGRQSIASRSVSDYGAIIITNSIEEAVDLANSFAPEHLELAVKDPFSLLGAVKAAGAVFLGHYTPEPVGDYVAGPSHVLPTGGTARFFSPLGVDHFIRRSSVISYSRKALEREAGSIIKLATVEGLDAHAKSVEIRMKQELPSIQKKPEYDKGDELSIGRYDVIQEIKGAHRHRGYGELPSMKGVPVFEDRGAGIGWKGIPDIKKPGVGGDSNE